MVTTFFYKKPLYKKYTGDWDLPPKFKRINYGNTKTFVLYRVLKLALNLYLVAYFKNIPA